MHKLSYPDLPISERIDEIKNLLEKNQVIIVGGETGSGKSTQLPKICLELGLSEQGKIAHTQPRRIAARTLSQRIAEEIQQDLQHQMSKGFVACKVRFSDSVTNDTQIKLMTDGMLLAEIEHDPLLKEYQCIIVDEVHERSLNIDFLLAYLKILLSKRQDLKVVLTSATIDLEKISQHFNKAPIIEVSGRTYPVEISYLEQDDSDLLLNIQSAIESILTYNKNPLAQDILIFLATENDIRQCSVFLRKYFEHGIDILPLYGRMPLEQQRKVFNSNSLRRRVILATNVAETSITVPGIGYVIDSGLARISRFQSKNNIQQLPIEKISKASAKQRAGRCGRIAPGHCFRLYSEADYEARKEYTEPEIKRTQLASILLKMASLKLGEIEKFPLLDMPEQKKISDARVYLNELQAVDKEKKLTSYGHFMARLNVDPRFSRMLLEANERSCLEDVLIIVSALSVNEIRLRPHEYQQQADACHEIYQHGRSDFYSLIKLWYLLENVRQAYSSNQFRKFCEINFISWSNLREWRDLHTQLGLQLKQNGFRLQKSPFINAVTLEHQDISDYLENSDQANQKYIDIHKSILTGCLSQIAHFDSNFNYQGLRHRQVFVFPASGIFKKKYSWIMSAHLIETSRLFAHYCAEIEPGWIVDLGKHILKARYYDAFWSKRMACVKVKREFSLQGLIVETGQVIKVTEEIRGLVKESPRDIFIQAALIERKYSKPPKQLVENWLYLDALENQENKFRQADIAPDDLWLLQFYQQKIPEHIYDARSFFSWLKNGHSQTLKIVLDNSNHNKREADFPETLVFGHVHAKCAYLFDPGSKQDGVSIEIPFDQLNQLSQSSLDWLIPGLFKEKCSFLLKSLPKDLRKQCMPIQQTVDFCVENIVFGEGDLLVSLTRVLQKKLGKPLTVNIFDLKKLPEHLVMNVKVLDEQGNVIAQGKNLVDLKNEIKIKFNNLLVQNEGHGKSLQGSTVPVCYQSWSFGDLELEQSIKREFVDLNKNNGSIIIKKFTALRDEGNSVSITYVDTLEEALYLHSAGQLKLATLVLSSLKRELKKQLKNLNSLSLTLFSAGDTNQLYSDLFSALVNQLCFFKDKNRLYVYKESDFNIALSFARSNFFVKAQAFVNLLNDMSNLVLKLRQGLDQPVSELRSIHHEMIRQNLNGLIYEGFLVSTTFPMLERYPVYLQGMLLRLDRLQGNIERDASLQAKLDAYRHRLGQYCKDNQYFQHDEYYLNLRWYLEEYSLSLFAQDLRPAFSVSEKDLENKFSELNI